MSIFEKRSGVWEESSDAYAKVASNWKVWNQAWVRVSGTWRRFFYREALNTTLTVGRFVGTGGVSFYGYTERPFTTTAEGALAADVEESGRTITTIHTTLIFDTYVLYMYLLGTADLEFYSLSVGGTEFLKADAAQDVSGGYRRYLWGTNPVDVMGTTIGATRSVVIRRV